MCEALAWFVFSIVGIVVAINVALCFYDAALERERERHFMEHYRKRGWM